MQIPGFSLMDSSLFHGAVILKQTYPEEQPGELKISQSYALKAKC